MRNVAIILVIAAAVAFVPGGGRVASAVEATLWVGFAIGFAAIGLRMYRERRMDLYALGDRHRALLYYGIATAVFAIAARARMWQTGVGELVWFLLVIGVAYAFMEVFRHSRSY